MGGQDWGSTQFHWFFILCIVLQPFFMDVKTFFLFELAPTVRFFTWIFASKKHWNEFNREAVVENHRVCHWPPKNLPFLQPQRGSLAKAKYLFWRSRRIEPEEARALSEPEDQDRKVTTCDARTWRSDISRNIESQQWTTEYLKFLWRSKFYFAGLDHTPYPLSKTSDT